MRKLLLTGASGFLGWHICALAKKEWEIFGTVFSHPTELEGVNIVKADLTDFNELKRIFNAVRPDAVIHTAAIRDPNFCQSNRKETEKINIDASLNIAGLSADSGIPFAFTSSDLVFNGKKAPYREEDPVSPVSFYGEQKVIAEEEILKRSRHVAVFRLPLMFGVGPAASSIILPMIKAMRDGRELRLFVDEFRTPISGSSAARGLLMIFEKVKGIIHLGGSERISRYDLGRLVMDVFAIKNAKLKPCKQKDMVMAAPRPLDVSLDSSKALAFGFRTLSLIEELKGLQIQ